jgi:hypothetical protein
VGRTPEALCGIINDRKRNNAEAVLRGLLWHVQSFAKAVTVRATDEHLALAERALLAVVNHVSSACCFFSMPSLTSHSGYQPCLSFVLDSNRVS